MDPATLAAAALTVLSPYLVKAGEKVAEKIGASLPANAGKLWTVLTAKLNGKPAAEVAVKDLAENPVDEDNQAAFRKELRKALTEDPQFLAAIAELLEKAQKESQPINNSAVAGEGSTAVNVGGNVQGNIVVGSHNSVNNPNRKK